MQDLSTSAAILRFAGQSTPGDVAQGSSSFRLSGIADVCSMAITQRKAFEVE